MAISHYNRRVGGDTSCGTVLPIEILNQAMKDAHYERFLL